MGKENHDAHDHDHRGHHHHHHHHNGADNIAVVFFLNLAFTIVEIFGGIFTNSVAILSDALHDMGDTVALGLAWYFQKLSHKGRTDQFTFGYKRFNTLGAIITGLILVIGSVYIFLESVPRLFHPEEVNAKGMIWLAILGVIVNGAAVLKLRTGKDPSLNEKMITWHLIEDVLGWIVVLIGSIILLFFNLPWIDPLLSILITSYILYNVVKNLWNASKIILQGTPSRFSIDAIKENICRQDGVEDVRNIQLWSLDGEHHIFSAHIVADASHTLLGLKPIRSAINNLLREEYKIAQVILEFKTMEECMEVEKANCESE